MMGKFKDFNEHQKVGTYVSCSYIPDTNVDLATWCVQNLINDPLVPADYHTTILYSRSQVFNAEEIIAKKNDDLQFKAKGFKLFPSTEDPSKSALAIELEAPELIKIHESFIKAEGIHDFPDYTPHITLTYSADSMMDLSHLRIPDFKFKVNKFKVEPLDINEKK